MCVFVCVCVYIYIYVRNLYYTGGAAVERFLHKCQSTDVPMLVQHEFGDYEQDYASFEKTVICGHYAIEAIIAPEI